MSLSFNRVAPFKYLSMHHGMMHGQGCDGVPLKSNRLLSMKQLNESWSHYWQQLIACLQTARDSVKTYRHPHAALLTGAALFVVWWLCNLLFFIENRLTCRLLLMIPGLCLYSLLLRKGDLFFLSLYKSSFMRGVLLCGRRVEILLYTSIPLSMLFSSFLVSVVILSMIGYAAPVILSGFKIPFLPYLVVRAAIAIEGGVTDSLYMERIPYFHETHLLITSEDAKSGRVVIGYCVSVLLLALFNLGSMERSRIKDLKDSFLEGLHAKEVHQSRAGVLCPHWDCSLLPSSDSDRIVELSARAEEACSRATSQWAFRVGCKAAASTLGLRCSPLSCFGGEIAALEGNPCVYKTCFASQSISCNCPC